MELWDKNQNENNIIDYEAKDEDNDIYMNDINHSNNHNNNKKKNQQRIQERKKDIK